jgi:aryl-alcohol dehydrogenase-like predicted oxidoreductase
MNRPAETPLILGGHSFISQLGNDPAPSEEEQQRIVQSCLENGIRWFDTTYQPERVALGKVLDVLGRRSEANILAWNFFTDFSPGDPVGEAEYYRPEHIETILDELHTSYVDCLVMVPLGDPAEAKRQEKLLVEWQRKGYVQSLGVWISDPMLGKHSRDRTPFRFAIGPFNITTPNASSIFAGYKRLGWETIATSPFVRGWELDRRIAKASLLGYGDAESLRPKLADLMLRFSLFHSNAGRVIVAMRKLEWITANVASVSKGALTCDELLWLERLCRASSNPLWKRVRQVLSALHKM